MNIRYTICLLLVTMNLLTSEKFSVQICDNNIFSNNKLNAEFILCTSSENLLLECGVFLVHDKKLTLGLCLQINNEDVENFTDTICEVVFWLNNQYKITIQHACFAAPGVPSADNTYLTHWRLPYNIDAKEILNRAPLRTATIVNDFLAMSYGLDLIDKEDIVPLYDALPEEHGRRAIIGAGDGLGSVTMIWDELRQSYASFPCEAGTGNFPALNQFEFDLAECMKSIRNTNTMHWAYFVSLSGIQYTYKILKSMNCYHNSLDFTDPDGITILAHANDDQCCGATADLFFKLYARFAYNFVWTTLPFGGLYLVGTTAVQYPHLLSEIFLPEFFNCVVSKQSLLKRVPIYMIQSENNMRLYGAARYLLITHSC